MKKLILLLFATFLFSKSITIYNNNLAYINNSKEYNLSKGLQEIKFSNLPDSLIADSIFAEFNSSYVNIISQSFYKSNFNLSSILKTNLNKEVEFFTKDKKRLSGKLISINPNIIKSSDKYYTVSSQDIIFTTLLNINKKPYLKWQVLAIKDIKSTLNIDYLIKGISWKANYVVKLKKDSLILKAWAKIDNKTNKEFKDINCSLVAGDLNPVQNINRRYYSRAFKKAAPLEMADKKKGIKANSLSGYYIYHIPFKVSIRSNEQKEFLLINAKDVKYKKYAVANSRYFAQNGNEKLIFNQVIDFLNSKENNLGVPLPFGVVRAYTNGAYIGSSHIKNIAKNELVKLNIGRFFDIIGEKRVVKYISKPKYKNFKTSYTLKNRSKEEMTLKLKENIPKYGNKVDFKTSCSKICTYKNLNAYTREFSIKLKPNKIYTFTTEYEIYF